MQALQFEFSAKLSALSDIAFSIISCPDGTRAQQLESLSIQWRQLLEEYHPAICVHLGQSPKCIKPTIERLATNRFMHLEIDSDGPLYIRTTLPGLESLVLHLTSQGLDCGFSDDAGDYLCNLLFYKSLRFARTDSGSRRVGLIHVPLLPGQINDEHELDCSLPLDETTRIVTGIIEHLVQHPSY